MLNPNLGNLQSKQLTLGGIKGAQPLTPTPIGGDEPVITPNAVFVGSGRSDGAWIAPGDPRTGDVVILDDGAFRIKIDDSGEIHLEATTVTSKDFENDRGVHPGW